VCGWAFWSAVLLWVQWRRQTNGVWPEFVTPWAAVGPVVLGAVFAVSAWVRVRKIGYGVRAAEKINRYGSLWLALYACAWLLGAGQWRAGLLLVALAAAGFLGMTVLRELYGLVEEPMGYRR
jgi:hypothetical protein